METTEPVAFLWSKQCCQLCSDQTYQWLRYYDFCFLEQSRISMLDFSVVSWPPRLFPDFSPYYNLFNLPKSSPWYVKDMFFILFFLMLFSYFLCPSSVLCSCLRLCISSGCYSVQSSSRAYVLDSLLKLKLTPFSKEYLRLASKTKSNTELNILHVPLLLKPYFLSAQNRY